MVSPDDTKSGFLPFAYAPPRMPDNVELVRRSFAEAEDLWDVLESDGNHYEDLGDRVVVAGTCRVRGRASGAESHPACAWIIGVRDGLIVSHRTCSTLGEAEKLAGVERAEGSAR